MIIKPTEYNGMNKEYRIWNAEYWIQLLQNSKFCSRSSTFNILHSARRGFTLVETLVAIAILLIAVVGPVSLIGDALHKLYYAKDEMIAINLAQEGIEVVRQRRDSNMLKINNGIPAVSWNDGIIAGNYTIGANSATITLFGGGNVTQPVMINGEFYEQGSGAATQFERIVSTENVVGAVGRELKVTSNVQWKTGGQTGSITVTEYLFKWAIP